MYLANLHLQRSITDRGLQPLHAIAEFAPKPCFSQAAPRQRPNGWVWQKCEGRPMLGRHETPVTGDFGSKTPQWPCWTFHLTSFPSVASGQTHIANLKASKSHWISPHFLSGIFPNKILAFSILFWHLVIRRLELTHSLCQQTVSSLRV